MSEPRFARKFMPHLFGFDGDGASRVVQEMDGLGRAVRRKNPLRHECLVVTRSDEGGNAVAL